MYRLLTPAVLTIPCLEFFYFSVIRCRLRAKVASPVPFTSRSCSTDSNGPFSSRQVIMAFALLSPTPLRTARSSIWAVLMLTVTSCPATTASSAKAKGTAENIKATAKNRTFIFNITNLLVVLIRTHHAYVFQARRRIKFCKGKRAPFFQSHLSIANGVYLSSFFSNALRSRASQ